MSTYGIFKGLYRNHGIYWKRTYNTDGDGNFKTIQELRDAIDKKIRLREEYENKQKQEKILSGKYIVLRKEQDQIKVTVPGKDPFYMRRFNFNPFDIEEKYGMDIIWE